ncbi:MAG: InlB B-repeat-containing protein [Clostridia bacterium]|nr:InlB B-repeat-containing protein [Clostridia bacterium]
MTKVKQTLSLLMCMLMLVTSLPVTALTTSAAAPSRHDFDVNFDYEYDTPEQALTASIGYKDFKQPGIIKNGIVWRHITSFDKGDESFRKKMMSQDSSDKYIVLDKDIDTKWGYGDDIETVVKSDKVLDLNGYKLKLKDIRNKVDTHDDWFDKYYQSSHSNHFNTQMIRIENGATLTIIDSSDSGKGSIMIDAYMINPYKHPIKRYTTRDLFSVEDGNLVIYGGTFQAGRSKQQSDDDIWEKIKAVVGSAVGLATDIAGYATPINAATGKLKDVNFNVSRALEKLKDQDQSEGEDPPEGDSSAGNSAKDRSQGEPEKQKETPVDKADTNGRNSTIDEKQKDNTKPGETAKKNEANKNGTAKKEEFDGNSKIAEAQNAVVNAATNKDALSKMVDSAFGFVDTVRAAFGTNEGSIVTQSFLGTVVNIGNGGTFVSYGGTYIGHGMTPNTRNAVVECTQGVFDDRGKQVAGGKAYIYDGTFEGRCGANVFNIVKENNNPVTVTQYMQDSKGNREEVKVTVPVEETNWTEVVYLDPTSTAENIKLIDTRNIHVRGGIFRCYNEYSMLGLHEDKDKPGDHNSDKPTMFAGTKGSVNLGVSSFGEDLIRDGRIQIVNNHVDGALVLMDEKTDDRGLHHYRLYCTEDELRYKQYLTVYPTESVANSSYSFSLTTRYNGADTSSDITEIWSDNEDNSRGVYSTDERFFKVEVDGDKMDTYYVVPEMSNPSDVYNDISDESETWYYNTPVTNSGKRLGTDLVLGYNYISGQIKNMSDKATFSQWKYAKIYDNATGYLDNDTLKYGQLSYNYMRNLKWLTYKIYKVDPLTRENLTDTYGEDQPVKTVVYGASTDDALRCQLAINKLGIDYKPGEMYRIELTVDEYVQFGDCVPSYSFTDIYSTKNTKELTKSSCTSSIVFMCYSKDEIISGDEPDFTPLQWVTKPEAGKTATVQLVNGKAGQIDWHKRQIFEVYYQWYAIDKSTGKEEMIAGTDNIYDDITLKNYNIHAFANWQSDTQHQYKNTRPLPDDRSTWTSEDIHFYPQASQKWKDFTKDGTDNLSLDNNNVFFNNTDSCYIPEEYNNHVIYCKAIVLNNFWPLNYDHRQTFRTPGEYVKTVELTFDPGEGQIVYGGNKIIATYLKPVGTLPTASKTGYTFDGWYIGDTKLTKDSIVRVLENVTVNARYTKNQAVITFDTNGGTCDTATKTVTYGEPYGTLPAPTRAGYTFAGWFDYAGKKIEAATVFTGAGTKQTLKARWGENCTLTLDVNGGNPLSKTTYTLVKNEPIGITLPTPTRSGYAFMGWINSAGNAVSSTSIISGNATIKASWRQAVTVTLNANGGTCGQSTVNLVDGQRAGKLPEATRTDYAFFGWYTAPTGGTRITADTIYDANKMPHTLYAQWKAQFGKVTFYAEKNDPEPYAIRYTEYGGYLSLEDFPEAPVKPGYALKGWYRTTTGQRFGNNDLCYNTTAVYGVWELADIQITFEGNGGLWQSPETWNFEIEGSRDYNVTYSRSMRDTLLLARDKISRFGYKFLGWFTQAEGGERIDYDSICEWTEPVTLYAHWQPEISRFSLILGYDGAPDMAQYTILEGEPWGSIPEPEREGYAFDGWYTGNGLIKLTPDRPCSSQEIYDNMKPGAFVINDIFAHWVALPVEIELDNCIPGHANTKLTVKGDEPYGELPAVTRKGYIFDGWFTEKNGGEKITAESIYNVNTKVLYAHYTKSAYTVTVTGDANGTATADKAAAYFGDKVTISTTPNDDCKVISVNADSLEIIDNNNNFTFTMPDNDVSISVTFHKHAWTLHESVKPTATSNGYDVYICPCGETKNETSTFAAGEHNMVLVPKMAATCTTNGIAFTCYRCVDCFDYFKDALGKTQITDLDSIILPINKNNHTVVIDSGKAATCTKAGISEGKHCSECGAVIKAQTVTAKLGHKYADKITKATQTKDGKIQSVCSVCGYTKTTSTAVPKIADITLSTSTYTYTGSAKKPAVTVKDSKGSKLVKDTDYTVTYSNNTNIGTATAKVTFKGKYSGTKSLEYKIIPANVSGLTATQTASTVKLSWTKVAGATSYKIYTYSSTAKKYTQKASTTATNYTVKGLKAGTAYTYYVKASKTVASKEYGSSAYTKIATGTAPANVTGLKATQTTSTVKLSWTKTANATGYKVYKYSSSTKKYTLIGTTAATSYTVKSLKAGTAYTYYVKAYKTVGGKDILSASYTKLQTGTKTAAPAAPKLTAGTKKITAKWTKVTGATGYELYMAASKSGTYSKIYSGTALTYTKSSLTKGKTMYFKVRTYKTVDGNKIYSAYSEIKSAKVK